ncbi:MAG: hypothetical protein J6Y94_05310, partial [Bacteriovoracaceae bacterium]|nr:hypothetical protein [Bacteriovoracaceae bacterium]
MSLKSFFKKILPPEEKKFFEYFGQAATLAQQAAVLFKEMVAAGGTEEQFQRASELKQKSVELAKLTITEVNQTFVTPIDREDIMYLSARLNKITKRTIRACRDLRIYHLKTYPTAMHQQADILITATRELTSNLALLRRHVDLEQATNANRRMMELEGSGDDLLIQAMEDMFSGKYDALTVIKFRNVYQAIE